MLKREMFFVQYQHSHRLALLAINQIVSSLELKWKKQQQQVCVNMRGKKQSLDIVIVLAQHRFQRIVSSIITADVFSSFPVFTCQTSTIKFFPPFFVSVKSKETVTMTTLFSSGTYIVIPR